MHKILAMLMALALSLSLLAGCASDKKAAPDSSAGKTVTTSVNTKSKENISTKGNDNKLKISEGVRSTLLPILTNLPNYHITTSQKMKLRSLAGRRRVP